MLRLHEGFGDSFASNGNEAGLGFGGYTTTSGIAGGKFSVAVGEGRGKFSCDVKLEFSLL